MCEGSKAPEVKLRCGSSVSVNNLQWRVSMCVCVGGGGSVFDGGDDRGAHLGRFEVVAAFD